MSILLWLEFDQNHQQPYGIIYSLWPSAIFANIKNHLKAPFMLTTMAQSPASFLRHLPSATYSSKSTNFGSLAHFLHTSHHTEQECCFSLPPSLPPFLNLSVHPSPILPPFLSSSLPPSLSPSSLPPSLSSSLPPSPSPSCQFWQSSPG